MQKVLLVSSTWLAALALLGCTTSPRQSEIEIRHTSPQVNGNSFQCTGTWPSSVTPCEFPVPSHPDTTATSQGPGTVALSLWRVPIVADSGGSLVRVELIVGADGKLVGATANESTNSGLAGKIIESSAATGGWIDPDAVSATPEGRNSAMFSLSFPFGTISGTYDTASLLPLHTARARGE